MHWYKAWLECRPRFFLVLMVSGVFLAILLLVMPLKIDSATGERLEELRSVYWRMTAILYAGVLAPIASLILAGAGLNSQTQWAMVQGFHPSLYYSLSMPVTRGQLLWSRFATGSGMALAILTAIHLLLTFGPAWRGVGGDPLIHLGQLPRMLLWSLTVYCFAVWLAALFDELWGSMIGLALAGGVLGYSMANPNSMGGVLGFLLAAPAEPTALGNVVLAACCALFLGLSFAIVQRRQY